MKYNPANSILVTQIFQERKELKPRRQKKLKILKILKILKNYLDISPLGFNIK